MTTPEQDGRAVACGIMDDAGIVVLWKDGVRPAANARLYPASVVEALERSLAEARAENEWRPVESAPTGKVVLVCVETSGMRQLVLRAELSGHNTLRLGDDQDDFPGCTEDEEGSLYVPAGGWYETNLNEETSWQVSERVLGWMPLPQTIKARAALAPQEKKS